MKKVEKITKADIKQDNIEQNNIKQDGWTNFLNNLGNVRRDKSLSLRPLNFVSLDKNTLVNIYAGDGIGSKIVNCVAEDMLKAGWEYDLEVEEKNKIETYLNNLNFRQKLKEVLIQKRLFGGSVIVLGVNDGQDLKMPVNKNRIKSIDYLAVFSCNEVDLQNSKTDDKDLEGRKLIYRIQNLENGKIFDVHRDRLLIFYGDYCPKKVGDSVKSYWGLSVLEKVFLYLSNLGAGFQYLSNILTEFLIKIFKIKDLALILSQPDGFQLFLNRLQAMDTSKGILNSIVLDKEEEFVVNTTSLNGLPELIDRMMLFLSASTNIPLTRLFGRSPAGLNATGEADMDSYYDMVQGYQETDLRANLNKIFEYCSLILNIRFPFEWWFNSLKQMTEAESWDIEKKKAEIERLRAETISRLVELGIIDVDEAKEIWIK